MASAVLQRNASIIPILSITNDSTAARVLHVRCRWQLAGAIALIAVDIPIISQIKRYMRYA